MSFICHKCKYIAKLSRNKTNTYFHRNDLIDTKIANNITKWGDNFVEFAMFCILFALIRFYEWSVARRALMCSDELSRINDEMGIASIVQSYSIFFRFVATSPNWKIIHHNYQNSSYDIFTIIIRTIVINAVDNIQYSLLYVTIHWKVLIFHFDDVSIEHCFFPIHFITLKHFHSSSPPLSSTSIFVSVMMWHLTQQHFPIYSFTIL